MVRLAQVAGRAPGDAEMAIQSPSGEFGANTCTRPISVLATPAKTSAKQKARNTW